jgi:phage tail sheath protein FI
MATSVSTYLNRKTPNVYITEIPAFGTSIVGVATAVPIFIGYTQYAGDPSSGNSLYMSPVSISSMAEYQQYFGGAAPANFAVTQTPNPAPPSGSGASAAAAPATPSFYAYSIGSSGTGSTIGFTLASTAVPGLPNQFNLYWSIQAFFANGGGDCYVVSVGSYWTGQLPTSTPPSPLPTGWILGTIQSGDLVNGITNAAAYATGPTMIVIPEACQLATYSNGAWTYNGYDAVVQNMMLQAGTMQDRVAIIDLPACQTANSYDMLTACQTGLANAIAPQVAYVNYAACYGPAVCATIVNTGDILYTNLQDSNPQNNLVINNILTSQAQQLYATNAATLTVIQGAIAQAFPVAASGGTNTAQNSGDPTAYVNTLSGQAWTNSAQQQLALDNFLLAALPVFGQVEQLIANSMNVLPPSGFLAGVWTKNDGLVGVWNAPANYALAQVTSPLYVMNDGEQAGFNVPINGQSICIIRSQPGRGNVVWGARTLDGNSGDYRYIQVRRALIYIEQSIKVALQPYVFAANDATTWSTVTAAISSFLTNFWQQGGLMGAKPTDAFTVSCGLGSTMTAQNILDGYMIVAVTLQMIHPAEFIELTFTQTMGT